MAHTYEHPRGALTVDCAVFGLDDNELKVMLIQWALPGGFVRTDETLDDAARRELEEEAGLRNVFLEQLYTFGEINRDPRERIVSVAYFALVKLSEHEAKAATDAANAQWFPVSQVRGLAFDHAEIVKRAVERLKGKVRYQP